MENYAEYTENRLIVKNVLAPSLVYTIKPEDIISPSIIKALKVNPLTTSNNTLMTMDVIYVLVGNENELVTMDNESLILLKDGYYLMIRTSPDLQYVVTPVSKPKNFTVACIPVNSNP